MDIRMPVLDGIAATRELRALPDPPEVVILTTFDTDEYAYQAFRAGACGFLVKDTPPVELLRAVHQTAAGGTVISPPTARRLVRDLAASRPDPRPTPAALQDLTERELEVLRLLARGHSNREIARELVISELTAKTRVSRILHQAPAPKPGPRGGLRLQDGAGHPRRRVLAIRHPAEAKVPPSGRRRPRPARLA